jgi:hypothetical protein
MRERERERVLSANLQFTFWNNTVIIQNTVEKGFPPLIFFLYIRRLPDDG